MEHTTGSAPASLKTICERVVFRYRDWLGDIGSVPVVLLETCLHACSAKHLARIEDETSEGGVDISVELAHHWKRCFEQRFGAFDASKEEAPVLDSASSASSCSGPVVDWRALYEGREERYEAKLKASAERLKQMTAAESSGKDSRSIQVLSALPRRLPAQKGFSHSAAAPIQATNTHHRLLRKLGMGSSKQGPTKGFKIIRKPPGSTSNVTKESGMGASALQLTECELDLTPSSSHFIPHALHDMASKASLANSGSLALRMTDNRFISQPTFEESLRAAPNSSKLKRHGQLLDSSEQLALRPDQASGRGVPKHGAWRSDQASPQTAKQGAVQARRKSPFSKLGRLAASNAISAYSAVPLGGHGKLHSNQSVSNSAAKSSVSQHVIASMQSAPAQPLSPPSSTSMHTQKHEQSNALGDALSLSRGKAQVSPQPKQSVLKNKLQPIRSEGSAEQPPKRIKYDHLLSGNALLSIAGRNRKK